MESFRSWSNSEFFEAVMGALRGHSNCVTVKSQQLPLLSSGSAQAVSLGFRASRAQQ